LGKRGERENKKNSLAFDSVKISVGYLECKESMWCMTHAGKNSGVVQEQS